jgi:hypothetical protein
MRKTITLLLIFGVLVWTGAVRSGDAKDARAIIDKAIKAGGGEEKLQRHQSTTFTEKGNYYGMGEGLPYTGSYHVQWPDQFKMEIQGLFTMVLNKDKGWMNFGGEAKELGKEELANQIKDTKAGWICTLLPLKDKAFTLTVIGEAQVEKKPATGVKVTRKDYPEVQLYFDKDSGRLVKSGFRSFAQDLMKEVNLEHFYYDYKEMDGAQVPTRMVIKRDGKLFIDSTMVELKAGKIDNKVFAMP